MATACPISRGTTRVVGFFNINGSTDYATADLLWRDQSAGAVEVWLMSGATRVGIGPISGPLPDLTRSIVGAADFDKNRSTDIVFRKNGTTGLTQIQIWLMQSTIPMNIVNPFNLDAESVLGPRPETVRRRAHQPHHRPSTW